MNRLRDALLEEGVPVLPIGHVMDAEHTFSHIQWNMDVYRCKWHEVPPALQAERARLMRQAKRTFAGFTCMTWNATHFRMCSFGF